MSGVWTCLDMARNAMLVSLLIDCDTMMWSFSFFSKTSQQRLDAFPCDPLVTLVIL